jgi:sRNA-binding protein
MDDTPTVTEPQEAPPPMSKKAEREKAALALLTQLGDLYPTVFIREWGAMPKPLALKIRDDIAARMPGVDPQTLKAAMRLYFTRTVPLYWKALKAGAPRYDLDGNPRGEVTAEEQAQAEKDYAAWRERRKLKQEAKEAQAKAEANKAYAQVEASPQQDKPEGKAKADTPPAQAASEPAAGDRADTPTPAAAQPAPVPVVETTAPAKRDSVVYARAEKRVAPPSPKVQPVAVAAVVRKAVPLPKPTRPMAGKGKSPAPVPVVVKKGAKKR